MDRSGPTLFFLAILVPCAAVLAHTALWPTGHAVTSSPTQAVARSTSQAVTPSKNQPSPQTAPQAASQSAAVTTPHSSAPRTTAQNTVAASLTSTPTPAAPATPTSAASAARATFHDPAWKVSFDYPANWTFAKKDGEISTFHLDARSALHTTRLRAVTAIPENPYPASTFAGAYVYLSVTPHSNPAACEAQTVPPGRTPPAGYTTKEIAGIPFTHGHDEQKHICTTDRDEVYTTLHRGACYRFDLAMNNFCGGAVSGVKDITPQELENVRARMEAILATVRFDPK